MSNRFAQYTEYNPARTIARAKPNRAFSAIKKTLMHPVGGIAAFGVIGAAAMYDSDAGKSFASHMAQEGTKLAADIPADLALFSAG